SSSFCMCFFVQTNHTRKELLFLMFKEINLRNHSSLHKLFYSLTTYYADTLIHLYKIIFKKKIANNNYAKIHFLKQGYAVRTGKIIWMNVMDNSYYCVKNSSNLYIKNGLDSYMNSKA
ncbi:glycerophosphodiester phosphodiesterase family protein, partial [Lactobacillus crispatus]|nr:glycerophosphodiester phosphodiesterase family protein [Lactobacillus crispatus]